MTILSSLLILPACDGKSEDTSGGDGGTGDGGSDALVCTEQVAVSCEVQIISDLGFQDDEVSDGDVTTETDGTDFLTPIAASAGGSSASSTNPWVYVQFTAEGAVKVESDAEDSLESLDWDLGLLDAWQAALAIEWGATFISADRGVAAYPGPRWQAPVQSLRWVQRAESQPSSPPSSYSSRWARPAWPLSVSWH